MITLALKIKPILEELPKINQKAAIRKIYIDSSVRNEIHVGGYGREGFNYIADSIKSARLTNVYMNGSKAPMKLNI
jgi:hypothetical protein